MAATPTALTTRQHSAARIIGVAYLLLMATAMFAEYYAHGSLIVADNAAATAHNIQSHERLFRLGIVSNLFTFAGDIVLAWAFYVLLSPVNRDIALLAVFFRLAESVLLAANTLNSATVLLLLGGGAHLDGFTDAQLQGLARLLLSVDGAGYRTGLVFLGLGSALFAALLYQARYVPRLLAGWGVFASLALTAGCITLMIVPAWKDAMGSLYFAPIFLFEVGMGLWLLLRGLKSA